jgi:hypothetical protein
VGVAGHSLGGGIGWLARRHGLAANSITDAGFAMFAVGIAMGPDAVAAITPRLPRVTQSLARGAAGART